MTNKKRVLVVEDDPTIYPIIVRMIHRLNPNVLVEFAVSAEGAEDLLRGLRQKYDLIVSDISLAGHKSGVDLVNDCYFEIGKVPFVLTSANAKFNSRLPFLPKPYRYEDFAEKMSPYLSENSPTEAERTDFSATTAPLWEVWREQIVFAVVAITVLSFFFLLTGEMTHLPL